MSHFTKGALSRLTAVPGGPHGSKMEATVKASTPMAPSTKPVYQRNFGKAGFGTLYDNSICGTFVGLQYPASE